MNPDISLLLQIGGIIVAITAVVVYVKTKVDGQPLENENLWEKIHELDKWTQLYAIENLKTRLEIEKEIGNLKELVIRRDGKLDSIIEKLDDMAKKINRLEEESLKK